MKGQIGLFDGTRQFKIDRKVRLIELFAGIGSQAKALSRLGWDFEHWAVCEYDKYAVKSYNAIHGTNFEPSDITKLKGADLKITDTDKYIYIMTYSFPCQDLSLAGKQQGMGVGTRSGLLWEVERLLKETKHLPQVLLMENVPQVKGVKNIEQFRKWLSFLTSLGYSNKYECLNTKNYGIPQNRDRCFMVSILGDYDYEFPQGQQLQLSLKDMLESEVDEKYYLNDVQVQSILNSTFNQHSPIELEPMILDDTYGFEEKPRVYKDCPTIRAGRQGLKVLNNDSRIRKLTPRETWRLMGFTDEDFDKAQATGMSDSQLYKQAGNSIVVNVLEEIFKEME